MLKGLFFLILEWIWRRCKGCQLGILINLKVLVFHHISGTICSFQLPNFFFFLRDLLASLIFNCSHWPSSLSSSSVYLTFPSLLRTTSTKGVFQAKKFPPKKISSATVKKRNCHRRSCKQSETYLGITGEWSTQEERETGLPKEAPAPLPQKMSLEGVHLPSLNRQSFSRRAIWTCGYFPVTWEVLQQPCPEMSMA